VKALIFFFQPTQRRFEPRIEENPMLSTPSIRKVRRKVIAALYRPRLEALEDRWLPSSINTWVAPGSSGNWNAAANWSLGHVPTTTEIATFDASSTTVCTIDAPPNGTNTVSGINITSGYTGSIQDTVDIVFGPDGFVQNGASFTVIGSTNIFVGGDWTESIPSGFAPGAGTVNFNGNVTFQLLDSGGTPFNNLTHGGISTLQLVKNSLTVNGLLRNDSTLELNGLDLSVITATTIIGGTVQNSGAADTLTFGGFLSLLSSNSTSAILATGLGKAVLGGNVEAAGATISGNLDLGGVNRTFVASGLLISALVSDGGLTIEGGGPVELAHANTYTGGTIIKGGVKVDVDQALGPGTGGTTLDGGNLVFQGVNYSTPESLTIKGGIIFAEPSAGGGAQSTFDGPITIIGSSLFDVDGQNVVLTINGPIDATGMAASGNSNSIIARGDGSIYFNGPIVGTSTAFMTLQMYFGTSGNLQTGTAILNAANTYGGGTVLSGGTLLIGNDSAVGTGDLSLGGNSIPVPYSIGVIGASHALANNVTLSDAITVAPSPFTLTFNGVVSGPGSLILNGNLTLNGNNSYSGTTTVNAAVLTIGGNSPLGGGALILNAGSSLVPTANSAEMTNPVTLNGPATLGGTSNFTVAQPVTGTGSLTDTNPSTVAVGGDNNLSGSIIVTVGAINFGGITGTGSLVLDDGTTLLVPGTAGAALPGAIVFNGQSTLRFNNPNNTVTNLSGALSGPGGFIFVGGFSDWLILSGTSTYSGTTFVDGATLNVRGSQPNSPVVINNGGTLWGSGTVGDVTLNNGTLDPTQFGPGVVASTAILTTGNLKLNGGVVQFKLKEQLRAQGTTSSG
jgi:autotransporter-associated beta strand protein